ncbi:MAG: acetate--CoA ligase family protein [Desulfobacteraceae bacterium]|nr:acetate--CoA ligase family protein [Desulfobacteraceae bacterium]
MTETNIRYLLYPKSIAILGASTNLNKISGRPLKFLLKHGYEGKIYPINPKDDVKEIMGVPCFNNLKEISEPIDQALIALPAPMVEENLVKCAEAGVKSVILFSSGFAETDQKGREMQNKITDIASKAGIALCGPNCQGLINLNDNVISSFTNVLELDELCKGNVGVVSQSGALAGSILSLAQSEGIGFSHWITVGNEAVLDVADFVGFLATDPATRAIAVYSEGIKDAGKWYRACDAAAKEGKPIIVMKTGRSKIGGQAIVSHTGSVAGEDFIIDAFFNQNLCQRVYDIDEMLENIQMFSLDRNPGLGRTVILTSSGGAGIILADACSDNEIDLAHLEDGTEQKLKELVPKFASVINPIDVTAQFFQTLFTQDHDLMTKCLVEILEDENTDVLIIALTMAIGERAVKIAHDIVGAAQNTNKPIAVVWMAGDMAKDAYQVLRENKIPLYSSGGKCVKALKNLITFSGKLKSRTLDQKEKTSNSLQKNRETIERASKIIMGSERYLPEYTGRKVLSTYDIPIPKGELALSKEDALKISENLNFPLVLKIESQDILHKTDAGCVVANIQNNKDLERGYQQIMKNALLYTSTSRINGVLIEEMIDKGDGIEVIVGMKNDPIFGPSIILGLGGIFVEVFKEMVCKIAPLTKSTAHEMVEEFKGYPILKGIRSGKQLSIDALEDSLLRLSQLSVDFKDVISEIDINPLVVMEQERGVMALDALIIRKEN